MYLTPDRFRTMGFGVDLGDLEDADFVYILERASSLIDSYCAVPMQPSKHDFRGGSVTGEKHKWRLPDLTMTSEIGSRRVYVNHHPIKTLTGFRVMFTNTYHVDIAPSNLYINELEGWAEVVSVAAVVTGIYPIGINYGLYTPIAEVSYTYGYTFTVDNETLLATDGLTFRAANQFWSGTPTIKKNGAEQSSGYTVDLTEGTVTFDTAPTATDIITASYTHTLPPGIRDACAFITASILGDRELHQRGMGHLGMVRIAEMELRRDDSFGRSRKEVEAIPVEAAMLLDPYRFMSGR